MLHGFLNAATKNLAAHMKKTKTKLRGLSPQANELNIISFIFINKIIRLLHMFSKESG
jgi:hypothetical protein